MQQKLQYIPKARQKRTKNNEIMKGEMCVVTKGAYAFELVTEVGW